jgi:TatD DNase family protein
MLPALEEWSRACGGRLRDGRPLGIMHYFSGDAALAARYVELGFLISIHTSVTHPKAETLRAVVAGTAPGHIVLETDSPYGAPQRVRGRRNEPAYVRDAAKAVAEIRGVAEDAVALQMTENALWILGRAASVAQGGRRGDGR